jgi:hypothetical protein
MKEISTKQKESEWDKKNEIVLRSKFNLRTFLQTLDNRKFLVAAFGNILLASVLEN